MENKQCAPSISPFNILSLTTAHDASFSSSTSTPYFAKSPNSLAATSGAQSVREINPSFIFLAGGVILKEETTINTVASPMKKIDFLILSFMLCMFYYSYVDCCHYKNIYCFIATGLCKKEIRCKPYHRIKPGSGFFVRIRCCIRRSLSFCKRHTVFRIHY